MTSHRSSSVASDLGAQLRATAHEPDDDVAVQLRARLRHKMFGRGPSRAPSAPEVPAEPQMASPSSILPLLGWIVPAVAVVALLGMSVWLHRTRTEQTSPAVTSRPAVLPAHTSVPAETPVLQRADPGPALLAAAHLEGDPNARSIAITGAVHAAWADPSASRRLDATVALANRMRECGEPRRALGLVRAVLDDLELQPHTSPARARLLQSLAEVYDDLGRTRAAAGARAEAARLALADGSR